MTLRSTTLIATLGLFAAAATARAQSIEGGAAQVQPAAPIAPLAPPMSVQGSPPVGAPVPLPTAPAASAVAGPGVPRAEAPPPAKPAHVPLAKRWWFWAGLGGAAAGVVLAAIFLGPRSPYNGNASPGTVEVF